MNQIKQFSRLDPFENLLRGFFVRPINYNLSEEQHNDWLLRVDISEKTDKFLINADLPGIKKEKINVDIEGNLIKIEAESNVENEEKDGKLLRQERFYGKSSRSFQLSQDVDELKAQAKFTDGVLTLILPKKETAKSKKLQIQ